MKTPMTTPLKPPDDKPEAAPLLLLDPLVAPPVKNPLPFPATANEPDATTSARIPVTSEYVDELHRT